jgi:hypothetical protein
MQVTENDAREQIQKLVRTEVFRFSELQRRLLVYLAEKSLAGEADGLKEYAIGVDALRKPESYDPRRDASVRLQSGKLRGKISEYYRTEGQGDEVVIDFPKGHFRLLFSYRQHSSPTVAEDTRRRPYVAALLSVAALAIGFAGLSTYLGIRLVRVEKRNPVQVRAWTPALKEFWTPFLRNDNVTMICVGAPMFARVRNAGFFIRDSEVNNWTEAQTSGFMGKLNRIFPADTPRPWYNFTGVGEAAGAVFIGNALSSAGQRLHFSDSSQVTWNEIGEHNVVFVGPPKFIPQIDELPVVRELAVEAAGIRNLRPRAGEPAFLGDEYSDAEHENGRTHALISRLPGLHGTGEILIVGGTWTQGTMAASQYLTLETHVAELLSRIRLRSGELPHYFEAVLSVTTRHSTPVQVSYLFHHVLTPVQQVNASNRP